MRYFINGDEVTPERYDREACDNFNAGIMWEETQNEAGTKLYMTYEQD